MYPPTLIIIVLFFLYITSTTTTTTLVAAVDVTTTTTTTTATTATTTATTNVKECSTTSSNKITNFQVVDTSVALQPTFHVLMKSSSIIDLSDYPTCTINIIANVERIIEKSSNCDTENYNDKENDKEKENENIQCVQFFWDNTFVRNEKYAPYALYGNVDAKTFYAQKPSPLGTHILKTCIYMDEDCTKKFERHCKEMEITILDCNNNNNTNQSPPTIAPFDKNDDDADTDDTDNKDDGKDDDNDPTVAPVKSDDDKDDDDDDDDDECSTKNRVTGFELVNTEDPYRPIIQPLFYNKSSNIQNQQRTVTLIDLNDFPTCELNIYATVKQQGTTCDDNNYNTSAQIQCVQLSLGDDEIVQNERYSPYALYGNTGRFIRSGKPSIIGIPQTLQACTYTDSQCTIGKSGCLSINVIIQDCQIVDTTTPTTTGPTVPIMAEPTRKPNRIKSPSPTTHQQQQRPSIFPIVPTRKPNRISPTNTKRPLPDTIIAPTSKPNRTLPPTQTKRPSNIRTIDPTTDIPTIQPSIRIEAPSPIMVPTPTTTTTTSSPTIESTPPVPVTQRPVTSNNNDCISTVNNQQCISTIQKLQNVFDELENDDVISFCSDTTIVITTTLVISANRVTLCCETTNCQLESSSSSLLEPTQLLRITGDSVTLLRMTFHNGQSNTMNGGNVAIVGGGGNHKILSSTFMNGTTKQSGGNLYVDGGSDNNSSIRIDNSSFEEGKAADTGGGITIVGVSSIMIVKSNFIQNTASDGGAFYSYGSDINLFSAGQDITVTECTFENNEADIGGAVWIAALSGPDPKLRITESVFIKNRAKYTAGIGIIDASLDVLQLTLESNTARGNNVGDGSNDPSTQCNGFLTDLNSFRLQCIPGNDNFP